MHHGHGDLRPVLRLPQVEAAQGHRGPLACAGILDMFNELGDYILIILLSLHAKVNHLMYQNPL